MRARISGRAACCPPSTPRLRLVDGASEVTPQVDRLRFAFEALAVIPAAFALLVGVLYAVGAILTTAQLRAAHLPARDALQLLPLTALLARGASVFLEPFAFLLALLIVAFVAVYVEQRGYRLISRRRREIWPRELEILRNIRESTGAGTDEAWAAGSVLTQLELLAESYPEEGPAVTLRKIREARTVKERNDLIRRRIASLERRIVGKPDSYVPLVVPIVGLLVGVLGGPVEQIPVLVAVAAPMVVGSLSVGRLRGFVIMSIVGGALALLVVASLRPERLPTANLRLDDGNMARGQLVAETTGAFYIGVGKNRLKGFEAQHVLAVEIHSRHRHQGRSIVWYVKSLL
jgi:hypothetical protein